MHCKSIATLFHVNFDKCVNSIKNECSLVKLFIDIQRYNYFKKYYFSATLFNAIHEIFATRLFLQYLIRTLLTIIVVEKRIGDTCSNRDKAIFISPSANTFRKGMNLSPTILLDSDWKIHYITYLGGVTKYVPVFLGKKRKCCVGCVGGVTGCTLTL